MSLLLLSKCFTKLDAYKRDETSLCMDHINVFIILTDRHSGPVILQKLSFEHIEEKIISQAEHPASH